MKTESDGINDRFDEIGVSARDVTDEKSETFSRSSDTGEIQGKPIRPHPSMEFVPGTGLNWFMIESKSNNIGQRKDMRRVILCQRILQLVFPDDKDYDRVPFIFGGPATNSWTKFVPIRFCVIVDAISVSAITAERDSPIRIYPPLSKFIVDDVEYYVNLQGCSIAALFCDKFDNPIFMDVDFMSTGEYLFCDPGKKHYSQILKRKEFDSLKDGKHIVVGFGAYVQVVFPFTVDQFMKLG